VADAESAHQAEGARTVDADATDVSGTTTAALSNLELQDAQRPWLDIEALGLRLTPAEYTNRLSLRAAITTARTPAATVAHKAELEKIKSAHAEDMFHLREKADLAAANAQEIEELHAPIDQRDRSTRAAAELMEIGAMDREAILLQRQERKRLFMEETPIGKTSHALMSAADQLAKAQGLSVARPLSEASTRVLG
jgi:hypothetical protein